MISLRMITQKLTDYEALEIATKMQFNDIFASANVVSESGSYPSALESIAMQLGKTSSY